MGANNPEALTELTTQVAVIGGGLSGVCAAVASARLGADTVLVQDRPVLGGNASSEVRMHICGAASGHHRFGRETGIVEEIRLEDAFRNPHDRYPQKDWMLYEFVRREPRLTLWLNTRGGERVECAADGSIERVFCRQAHTEKAFWLRADLFIDCSGDGGVAARAGAEFRMGREARSEFDESLAPEQADRCVLGSSLMFEASDLGRPVPFVPPPWAKDFPTDESLPLRHHRLSITPERGIARGFWWIEFGGRMDTIADDEEIRDELIAVLFGVWDHLKNHGDHGIGNYVLDWIGAVPGKRESRRFIGDYILRQQDIEQQVLFADRVAFGGWPIDLHPPDGIYSPEPACEQHYPNDFYSIPFRSLYSGNVPNLLFAGRNISASHVALGSTRVMGTCAVLGQAVGTAAALCVRHDLVPRALGEQRMGGLQQQLLHDDCYLIGLKREDADDLAPRARITASSVAALAMVTGQDRVAVPPTLVQGFVASESRLDSAGLFLMSAGEGPARAQVRLFRSESLKLFRPGEPLAEGVVAAPPGEFAGRRMTVELGAELEPGGFYFLELTPEEPMVWFASSEEPPGTQAARWDEKQERWERLHGTFRFRLTPTHHPFGAGNVASGIARPEDEPHLWISEPGLPQWLEFEFDQPTTVGRMHVTFDTDLGRKFITSTPATCVKCYRLDCWTGDGWQTAFEESENHQRHRRHTFGPVTATRYRLTVLETWGAAEARIYEVRMY